MLPLALIRAHARAARARGGVRMRMLVRARVFKLPRLSLEDTHFYMFF